MGNPTGNDASKSGLPGYRVAVVVAVPAKPNTASQGKEEKSSWMDIARHARTHPKPSCRSIPWGATELLKEKALLFNARSWWREAQRPNPIAPDETRHGAGARLLIYQQDHLCVAPPGHRKEPTPRTSDPPASCSVAASQATRAGRAFLPSIRPSVGSFIPGNRDLSRLRPCGNAFLVANAGGGAVTEAAQEERCSRNSSSGGR